MNLGGALEGDEYGNAFYANPGFDHRWLTLRLRGTRSNRLAQGARVTVHVEQPDGSVRSIHRVVDSGGQLRRQQPADRGRPRQGDRDPVRRRSMAHRGLGAELHRLRTRPGLRTRRGRGRCAARRTSALRLADRTGARPSREPRSPRRSTLSPRSTPRPMRHIARFRTLALFALSSIVAAGCGGDGRRRRLRGPRSAPPRSSARTSTFSTDSPRSSDTILRVHPACSPTRTSRYTRGWAPGIPGARDACRTPEWTGRTSGARGWGRLRLAHRGSHRRTRCRDPHHGGRPALQSLRTGDLRRRADRGTS